MKPLNILVGAMGVLALGAAVLVMAPSAEGQERVLVERDSRNAPDRDVERQVGMAVFANRGSQIGVSIRDVEPADLATHKLPSPQGVVVEDVREASPAEKAGVKADDVVIEFDGERVRSARHLQRLVEETPSGREVPLAVMRAGQRVEMKVTPAGQDMAMWHKGGMPPMPGHIAPFEFRIPDIDIPRLEVEVRTGSRLGVMVTELSSQLAGYFGVKQGVLVTEVMEKSPAGAAGIKAGDVIVSVGGTAVHDAGDVRRGLRDLEASEVSVGIVRDKKEQTVTVTIERNESRDAPRSGRATL